MEHNEIKKLISVYFDKETTLQETELVEKHLQQCPECKKQLTEYSKLSSSLKKWSNEDLSPDLDQKWRTIPKEGTMTNTHVFRVSTTVAVSVLTVLVVLSVQSYIKRGVQGRLAYHVRDAVVYMSPKSTQVDELAKKTTLEKHFPGSATKTYKQLALNSGVQNGLGDKARLGVQGVARDLGGMQSLQYEPYYLETNFSVSKGPMPSNYSGPSQWNTEEYSTVNENEFLTVAQNPLSTFSIDVDTASYSNVRRFLNNNQLPPVDAVNIEELINYFTYDYPKPEGDAPFSITIKTAKCPWNKEHNLALIGLQGKVPEKLAPSNLVFLIDTSGSMNEPNKLPLLISAFNMMVNQLTDKEKVAIVTYAGSAGKVIDSTPGSDKNTILNALNSLSAGGSTAGGAGIELAYKIAKENFIPGGNNRVILATDGDFNVGVSSTGDLVRMIEEKRKEGIFLTVLGFGEGNYKGSRMEELADKGNGNYYYIDTLKEGNKVLVNELGSTLFTIAKDVKIQVEFNPVQVKAYKLVGYENRMLKKEDFNDDKKDAGELGAGHNVTAIYEIVPANAHEAFPNVDGLKYQSTQVVKSDDLMTVKLRYKKPDGEVSQLIEKTINQKDIQAEPVGDFQFAAAVAEYGLLLRNSKFKADASYAHVITAAKNSKGEDKFGYRDEFITLADKAQMIDTRSSGGVINFKGQK